MENKMTKNEFKEYCINMFLNGSSISKIASENKKSRKYITRLIEKDSRYIKKKNNKQNKVYKKKDGSHLIINIPTSFIENLGISRDINTAEYVNISYDEKDNKITITKA